MAYGKAIELFLVNGTVNSLITAELSNWNGKAIKIPRVEIAECTREDIRGTGIYFLFCHDDTGRESVYIGEAENVHERLVQHLRDFNINNEKYEWNTAVIFLGCGLNQSLCRYLQNSLVRQACECNRYAVLTKNTYLNTLEKEWQIAAMDEFIDNVKILISALGYKVFEAIEDEKYEEVDKNEESKSEDENFGYNWIRAKMLLDTIPGWQMRIGAMLSEGSLSNAEAESCREEINRLKAMFSNEKE